MACEYCSMKDVEISNLKSKLDKANEENTWINIARKIEDEAVAAGFPATAIPNVLARARGVDGTWEPHARHGAMVRRFGMDMRDDHGAPLSIRTWVKNLTLDPEASHWRTTAAASPTSGGMKNPYLKEHENFTEQGRLEASNPTMAKQMAEQAGVKLKLPA